MHRASPTVISLALIPVFLVASSCSKSIKPPAVPIAPNASVVTARVLQHQSMPLKPIVLTLQVLSVESLEEQLMSLVKPGETIEVWTKSASAQELLGQTIRATVRLRGDEWGQHYWLYDVQVLQP